MMSKLKKDSIFSIILLCCWQNLFCWDFEYADNESDTLYNGRYQVHQASKSKAMIEYYQQTVSPLQGSRCPCFPSCSDFTLYSMEQFGTLTGFIMGFERIFIREQSLLFTAGTYRRIKRFSVKHQLKSGFYDLPEANNIFLKKDWRVLSADFYSLYQSESR